MPVSTLTWSGMPSGRAPSTTTSSRPASRGPPCSLGGGRAEHDDPRAREQPSRSSSPSPTVATQSAFAPSLERRLGHGLGAVAVGVGLHDRPELGAAERRRSRRRLARSAPRSIVISERTSDPLRGVVTAADAAPSSSGSAGSRTGRAYPEYPGGMHRRSKQAVVAVAAAAVVAAAAFTAGGLADGSSISTFRGVQSGLCRFPVAVTVTTAGQSDQPTTTVMQYDFTGPSTIRLRNTQTGRTVTLHSSGSYTADTRTGSVAFHGHQVWLWWTGSHVPFMSTDGTGALVAPKFRLAPGRSTATRDRPVRAPVRLEARDDAPHEPRPVGAAGLRAQPDRLCTA